MSPDIEWHIGEEAEQETIAKTSPTQRSRGRTLGLIVIVLLGVGLGVAYRSIPGAAPRPTPAPRPTLLPTPTPPAVPAGLYETIEREADALADGNVDAYLTVLDPEDTRWRSQKLSALSSWGRPANGSPYAIIDFNLRTEDKAWADIRQYRDGRFFRETRFYRRYAGHWYRSDADPFFWSEQVETLDTSHLHVVYAVEDRELVRPITGQLEQAMTRLCSDLGCARTLNNCLEALGSMDCNPSQRSTITYTLAMNSIGAGVHFSDDGREIHLPSPRITGIYEDDQPIDFEKGDTILAMAWFTAQRRAYGQAESLSIHNRNAMLIAITLWAAPRAAPIRVDAVTSEFTLDVRSVLPLDALWNSVTASNASQMYSEAIAVTRFMSQVYGPRSIAKFLRAMGTAHSFSEAVETGVGVRFADFDRQWAAWVKTTFGGSG
jgi:hypothetical protein